MWLALFCGYCLFCANWLIFSKLKGGTTSGSSGGSNGGSSGGSNGGGWHSQFSAIATGVAEEAVNYSVTIARGIFTIPASYILVKLGYKRACLLAFGLATVALPLVFSPHWSVLILGRLIMASGGTLTIIYISPLLAKLVLPEKKQKLAMLNGFTYAISGLIVNVLFMIKAVSEFFIKHWQWVASSVAIFSFFPLILFYIYGRNFEIISLSERLNVKSPENYTTLLREREPWNWIMTYSGMLVVSILCSSFAPQKLAKTLPELPKNMSGLEWTSLYTVMFFLGTCFGLYFLGKLNTKNIRRVSIVRFSIASVLAIWAFILSISFIAYLVTEPAVIIIANILIFTAVFFFACFGLGIQSVLLYIPLEYKDYSPQKTSIFFSCLWGIGYIVLTAYYVLASILDTYATSYSSLAFITCLLIMFYFMSTKLRESRPNYENFVDWMKINWFPRRSRLPFN